MGRDVTTLPPRLRGVGFVMQGAALFPHLSVRDNIAFGPRAAGHTEGRTRETTGRLAALLGVAPLLDRRADVLSGGERQRVAIARALGTGAQVLLLDEPLAALDPPARAALRETLRAVHREMGATTLHVTHDLEEAAVLADRVGVLLDGAIAQTGPPDEVLRRPATPGVARFIGVRNVLAGELRRAGDGAEFVTRGGLRISVAPSSSHASRAVVQPQDIVLARAPFHSSAANRLLGRVADVELRGPVCHITIEVEGETLTALVLERSARELELAPDAPIHLAFKATAVHLL